MNINKFNSGHLLAIASDLNSSLDLTFILDTINEKRTLLLLSSKRATVYRLDDKKEYLMPIVTLDSPFKTKLMSENIIIKSSLAGKVVQAEKGIIFNDTSSHPEAFHIPGTPDVENENLIVVPLVVENEIWGTLNLYRSEKLYTIKDLELAEMFALYIGSAIYNALVYQELIREIQEREQSDKELKESERKYRTLVENSSSVMWITKEDGSTTFISDNVKKIYGYSPEELYNGGQELWFKRIHKDDRELVIDNFNKLFKNNAIFVTDYRIRHKNGHYIWLRDRSNIVIEQNGKKIAYGAFTDVTEEKNNIINLTISEIKFRSVLENVQLIGVMLDNKANIIFANDYLLKLTGWKRNEIIGKNWIDIFIGKDIKSEINRVFIKTIKEDAIVSHYENEILTKKGERLAIKWNNTQHYDHDGKPISITSIGEDITERKQAEKVLKESQIKYLKLFESNPNSVTLTSFETGQIIEVNDGFSQMLGYSKDEVIGKTTMELGLWSDPNDREKMITSLNNNGKIINMEIKLNTKSGKTIVCILNSDTVEMGSVSSLISVTIDITDRRLAEQELTLAYKEIKSLKDKLQAENIFLKKSVITNDLHIDIVGSSPQIKAAVSRALQVAPQDTNVLILGETGTGKELFARGIHDASKRKDKTLVTVNCAAIPDNLIESELFGHEKGAFTDAQTKKIGLFEIADGSTLFLDEIGELPVNLQSKLLRVLENREITRVGSNKPIRIDVRIIAATNQDLTALVNSKKFRQDLFYRLNVFPIELPTLRIRKQDIKRLVEKFVVEFNQRMGKKISKISKKTISTLESYNWPGNVRELKNVIERSMIMSYGNNLKLELNYVSQSVHEELTTLRDIERNHILSTLNKTYWKIGGKGGAAEILGVNRNTLNSRIKKLGIKRP